MKAEFYDVKSRTKIEAEVKYKVKYENGHFGIVGEAPDGRKLPKFVSEEAYNTTYNINPEAYMFVSKTLCNTADIPSKTFCLSPRTEIKKTENQHTQHSYDYH